MLKRCCVLLAALLGACGDGGSTASAPAITVYRDHFEFRGERYATVSTLSVGLTAAGAEALSVDVRECIERQRLVALISLLRERKLDDVAIALPQDC